MLVSKIRLGAAKNVTVKVFQKLADGELQGRRNIGRACEEMRVLSAAAGRTTDEGGNRKGDDGLLSGPGQSPSGGAQFHDGAARSFLQEVRGQLGHSGFSHFGY